MIPPGDLLRRPGETPHRSRTELLRILRKSLSRVRPGYHVPLDYNIDTWAFRRIHVRDKLVHIPVSRLAGVVKVDDAVLLFYHQLLRADFRSHNKSLSGDYLLFTKW